MRRYLLVILAAGLVLSACSGSANGSSHSAASVVQAAPAVTTTTAPLVSIDKVGAYPFCSSEDGFCADFPYVQNPDPSRPNFTVQSIPARNGTTAFHSYGSDLAWGYDGSTMVFCASSIDPHCFNSKLTYDTGVPQDGYSVFVSLDVHPATSLDQVDQDCAGWDNRQATPMTFAGQPALHVTCTYHSTPAGMHNLIYLRYHGKIYEVAAVDQVHQPFFSQKFFDSFRFTA